MSLSAVSSATSCRRASIAFVTTDFWPSLPARKTLRELLAVPKPQPLPDNDSGPTEPSTTAHPCPCCGGRMIIIEAFAPGCQPHHRPSATTIAIIIDTSCSPPLESDDARPISYRA